MISKNDLEELVRQRLNLPDNAVITSAMVRIVSESEEVEIVGKVSVEFQVEEAIEDTSEDAPPLTSTDRKFKKLGKKVPKMKLLTNKAVPGTGGKITDEQVKGYKVVLHSRKYLKKLTDNQMAALAALEGVRVANMTVEQRQQLKDIWSESGS